MFTFAGIGRRLVGSNGGSDRLASKLFLDRGGIAVIDLCRQLAAIVSCERKAGRCRVAFVTKYIGLGLHLLRRR